jgi:hypothetical protein
MDFRWQHADISGIPCLVLERAGAGKRRRWLAGKAKQNYQCDKTSNGNHRHFSCFELSEFALGLAQYLDAFFQENALVARQPLAVADILNDRYRVTGREGMSEGFVEPLICKFPIRILHSKLR